MNTTVANFHGVAAKAAALPPAEKNQWRRTFSPEAWMALRWIILFRNKPTGEGMFHSGRTQFALQKNPRNALKEFAALLYHELNCLDERVYPSKINWQQALAIKIELRLIETYLDRISSSVDAPIAKLKEPIYLQVWQELGVITKDPSTGVFVFPEDPAQLTSEEVLSLRASRVFSQIKHYEHLALADIRLIFKSIDNIMLLLGIDENRFN